MLVDHRQNGHGKRIALVYSVRPKPGAPVSTPLRWEELTPKVQPRDFSMAVALEFERNSDGDAGPIWRVTGSRVCSAGVSLG